MANKNQIWCGRSLNGADQSFYKATSYDIQDDRRYYQKENDLNGQCRFKIQLTTYRKQITGHLADIFSDTFKIVYTLVYKYKNCTNSSKCVCLFTAHCHWHRNSQVQNIPYN